MMQKSHKEEIDALEFQIMRMNEHNNINSDTDSESDVSD